MPSSRTKLVAAFLIVSAATVSIAYAHQTGADCGQYGRGGDNVVTLPPVAGEEALYVDRAQVGPPNFVAFWLYMESNGHPGLQTRAGEGSALVGDLSRESCTIASGHASVTQPDTFLF